MFAQVERSSADYGIVPVENSWAGVVPETLDTFMNSNLRVVSEVYQPITHNLLTRCESLEQVKRLYTHFQPLAQCRQWLRNHLPHVEKIEASSTSRAAELAAQDPESAAIATSLAAERYDLPILCDHIEDNPSNRTRFLVLGYNEPEPTGKDKTSLMFSVPNRGGRTGARAERLREVRREPDDDRVAPEQDRSLAVSLLHRCAGPYRRCARSQRPSTC